MIVAELTQVLLDLSMQLLRRSCGSVKTLEFAGSTSPQAASPDQLARVSAGRTVMHVMSCCGGGGTGRWYCEEHARGGGSDGPSDRSGDGRDRRGGWPLRRATSTRRISGGGGCRRRAAGLCPAAVPVGVGKALWSCHLLVLGIDRGNATAPQNLFTPAVDIAPPPTSCSPATRAIQSAPRPNSSATWPPPGSSRTTCCASTPRPSPAPCALSRESTHARTHGHPARVPWR